LCNPQGVAVDTSGNLYIADYRNARVRRVAVASGVISTVAGSATASSLGDGGPATSAELQSPVAVAVDGPGNLYIADSSENRIRKVSPSGVITTVAGNGSTILPGSGTIGDGGLATSAAVGGPSGLAVDGSGNLYISQFSLNSVRKVSAGSGIINTIAGGN
jgi:sugar lactone lactonase YvrE